MILWGISALSHDASITVVEDSNILFAGHSERYSKQKNDKHLNDGIREAAKKFGEPDKIIWFERPLIKKTRQAYSGEWDEITKPTPKTYLKQIGLNAPIEYVDHHQSHAAGGYFTSSFSDASILVCDAIGEWLTTSIWEAKGTSMRKIFTQSYPHSIGLFYSAITHRVGLKPNEEEYILMGMAAYGKPRFVESLRKDIIDISFAPNFELKRNLHKGCMDYLVDDIITEQDKYDLAASAQVIVEEYLINTVKWMRKNLSSSNLVLSGGVALNCVANSKIASQKIFDKLWIMPNPGDAGSSLGALAAYQNKHLNWESPYLGTNIDRPFLTREILRDLEVNKICAIANGKAEFGPRSLGNRALIADPRGSEIKDAVNSIKRRQKFRPFAPMVMQEFAHDFFEMPNEESPFMQFTAKCKTPNLLPAICHVDETSRVQTVTEQQNPNIYNLLKEFYHRTGCPILLNTSLNIKGQPLVDTWEDAEAFKAAHYVNVW
jgi:carbamoyltransferase